MNVRESAAREASWRILGTPGRNYYRVSKDTVDMTREAGPPRAVRVNALPQEVVFDLNRAALIVVDMQNEFCSPHGWLAAMGADVSGARQPIEPIQRMTAALRSVEVPVIWVNWGVRADRLNLSPGLQHTFNPDGCAAGLGDPLKPAGAVAQEHRVLQKGSWGAALVDALVPAPGDVLVDKHRLSGFWDTPLDSILRNLNVRTLLFSGINADQCVFGTLVDASNLGYDVILVEDATATTSPQFCLEATLYNVRFCYGFTVMSADLVSAIGSVPR